MMMMMMISRAEIIITIVNRIISYNCKSDYKLWLQFGLYYPRVYSQNEIYDIGTEILSLTKNDHISTQKTPKSIIPQEIKSAGHSPSSGSVKSRFKAIFKKWPSWIRRCCFSWIFAPGGRLNHGAYDVRTIVFMISKNTIPYIGTEILLLTKNDHNSTQKAPKSIIPQEIKSAGHFPSSDSVKSRIKALFKKWPSWTRRCCFT